AALAEADPLRVDVGDVVRGRHEIRDDVHADGGQHEDTAAQQHDDVVVDLLEQLCRVEHGLAVHGHRGGRHDDGCERECGPVDRQAPCVALHDVSPGRGETR